MFIRAFMRKKLMLPGSVLNRALSLICIVALVTVTFTHSVHHFAGSSPAYAVQAVASSLDISPDSSKQAPVVEYCFGCSMIALPYLAPVIIPHRLATDLPMQKIDDERPHPPVVEVPPPISTI
jgi:hypothetical protein